MTFTTQNEHEIREYHKNDPNAILIREWHRWQEFNEGDVIIRQKRFGYGSMVKWDIDKVSNKCPVPKKFKIVKIDDYGIPWTKQISVRGGLGSNLASLAGTTNGYRYELDPEKELAVILGVDYEPRSQYRKWRKDNPEYGGET
jgi:hypothetical protein